MPFKSYFRCRQSRSVHFWLSGSRFGSFESCSFDLKTSYFRIRSEISSYGFVRIFLQLSCRTNEVHTRVFERVSSSLNIHRTLLEQARVGSNHLVYRFIFTSEHHLDEQIVIVDAHNGEILLSDSTHDHALDRKVTLPGEGVLFTEGQQTPDNADIARLLGVSGAVHTVMMNAGGWDGPDLKGKKRLN